jgi:ubiquinone/menaquinone biosynthesis C-methylase UbiE
MIRQFGCLEPESWQTDLSEGFKELWRLLKPGGTIVFKWCSVDISTDKVLKLFPVKPIVYQISANKKNTYENGKRIREVQTLWFSFFKNPVALNANQQSRSKE